MVSTVVSVGVIFGIEAIGNGVGLLACSVYDRGSLSADVATTRQEVLTLKGYADAVLADLLQIHK
jgi:hypothetical protein